MRAGVLNLDKAPGATSFTMVRRLRELTGAHRVGHAGTLDPLATGVLPILFESATRLADFAHQLPKTYLADIHLGFTTGTDDAEAEPKVVADPSGLDAELVAGALAGFVGRIMQRPPAYSAVKLAGKRSYELARQGEDLRPAAREVEVFSARLLDFQPGPHAVASIEVVCGSGTYLRALARDLGERLGVGGYLGRLVRSAYGELRLPDSASLEDLADGAAVEARLLPCEAILPAMERVRLTIELEALVRQGRQVRVLPEPGWGPLRAHAEDGRLVALGHADPLRRTFVPDKVLT
ncbi:MAG: tRNA pseudouridine(55) synthase TruB [Chloroflexi bacterium]|nr:MAG: tRNA pseudouridine(55) synthase TruB [Chloroflexota bacterium]